MLGSRAFGAAARNVWLVAEDAEDRDRRLLVSVKQNRTAPPTGLAFIIERVGGRLRWATEGVSVDADEALAATAYQPPPRNQLLRQVIAWLEELLADQSLPPSVVRESAAAQGFSYTTLRRAFHEMGGQLIREQQGRKSVPLWQLAPEPDDE